MKKNCIFIAVSAVIMLFLPWCAVTFVSDGGFSDCGMAACFLLFYAVNPMASIIIGILSGRNIRSFWFQPVVLSILFLFGTWILFNVREFIFYGIFYFILGCAAMLITSLIVRKRAG